MHIRKRTTCRVCGSPALKKVIDLGPQYLQGSFVKPGKEMPSTRKINCTLVRCNPEEDENACGLLQMLHSVPPEILNQVPLVAEAKMGANWGEMKEVAE